MEQADVRGLCPARFGRVADAFAANFSDGLELGARFALSLNGEIVIDLMSGWADRRETRRFDEATLTPIFSTTKAVAAFMIARLAGEGGLDYDQPVADLWPEFAHDGKGGLTIAQALSHQAGLAGLEGPMAPADWFDWEGVTARLASMAPLWPPGTASGYHPVTFGYLAGELFRRADGRSLGAALSDDVAGPLGLDLWIGLPDAEHARVAEVRRPPAMPDLGVLTHIKRLAFLEKWSSPGGVSEADWRRAEIPSVNGHATAPALAKLMAALACDGLVGARRVLAPGVARKASEQRVAGSDLVLPYDLAWAAGFLRNERLGAYGPGAATIGHSGWGGSCCFADPDRGLGGAYVMNRQSTALVADPRAGRLIEAAYACL